MESATGHQKAYKLTGTSICFIFRILHTRLCPQNRISICFADSADTFYAKPVGLQAMLKRLKEDQIAVVMCSISFILQMTALFGKLHVAIYSISICEGKKSQTLVSSFLFFDQMQTKQLKNSQQKDKRKNLDRKE